jgi:hypothetical protein
MFFNYMPTIFGELVCRARAVGERGGSYCLRRVHFGRCGGGGRGGFVGHVCLLFFVRAPENVYYVFGLTVGQPQRILRVDFWP